MDACSNSARTPAALKLFSALGAALISTGMASARAAERSERGASDAFDCVIEPWQTVKLSSAVAGCPIREVTVDRGDFVKKRASRRRELEAGVEEASLWRSPRPRRRAINRSSRRWPSSITCATNMIDPRR